MLRWVLCAAALLLALACAPAAAQFAPFMVNGAGGVIATPVLNASGPAGGSINVPSSNFTVSVSGTTFSGAQTVTISDGGQGGLLTPSVGSAGTSSVTVTPAPGATGFTFSYTPAVAGTIVLSFSNPQGWTNPSPLNYAVTGAGGGALVLSQTWDASTSLPSGWTFSNAPTIDGSGNHAVSGNNGFAAPNNVANGIPQLFNTADSNSGNVTVSAKFKFSNTSSPSSARVICRDSGTLVSYYGAILVFNGNVGVAGAAGPLFQVFSTVSTNTQAVIGSAVTPAGGYVAGTWYRVFLECAGSTIGGKVRRETDGYWLQANGSWAATEAFASQASNTVVAGAGQVGFVTRTDTAATTVYSDDFEVYKNSAYPAAQAISLGPTSKLLAGYANHRTGYAVSLFANGSLAAAQLVTLSDGGIGGRFYLGAQSFVAVTTVSLPSNNALANLALFYCPPYNRTAPVTLTASSSFAATSTSVTITPYPVSSTPSATNVTWDAVAEVLLGVGTQLGAAGFFASMLPFQAQGPITSLAGYTPLSGNTGNAPVLSSGNFTVNGGKQWYRLNTSVPHTEYQMEIQVNAWGGGATDIVDVGFAIDGTHYFVAEYDHNAQTLKVFMNTGSGQAQLGSTVSGLNLPAGSKLSISPRVAFPGGNQTRLDVQYQVAGSSSYTSLPAIFSGTAVNWCLLTVFPNYFPFFGVNESAGSTISVTNFTAGYRQAAPANNTMVIWSVDQGGGNPLLASDGSIYVAGNFHGETAIFKLDTKTWALTQVSTVFLNDGTCEGVGPDSMSYMPTTNQFVMLGNNAGITMSLSPAQEATEGVLTTSIDLVASGTVFPAAGVALSTAATSTVAWPGTRAAGTVPGFWWQNANLAFNGSTWTVYASVSGVAGASPGTWAIVKATSSGSSIAGSTWTQVYKQAASGSIADGVVINHIGSNNYVGFGNQYNQVVANEATPGTQTTLTQSTLDFRGGSNANFGYGPQSAASWNIIAPVPGETANQTRYVFPIWVEQNGLDSLLMYEALTRNSAAQFTWHTKD